MVFIDLTLRAPLLSCFLAELLPNLKVYLHSTQAVVMLIKSQLTFYLPCNMLFLAGKTILYYSLALQTNSPVNLLPEVANALLIAH